MGTLPTAQRCNRHGLDADGVIAHASFGPAAEPYQGDSIAAKLRVSLKSLVDGFKVHDGPIRNLCYMAGRDGQLKQDPFKFSTAKSFPDKGGCGPVTFSNSLHITHYPVGATGYVLFTLNAHETWMIVEPFACDRPQRIAAL